MCAVYALSEPTYYIHVLLLDPFQVDLLWCIVRGLTEGIKHMH